MFVSAVIYFCSTGKFFPVCSTGRCLRMCIRSYLAGEKTVQSIRRNLVAEKTGA